MMCSCPRVCVIRRRGTSPGWGSVRKTEDRLRPEWQHGRMRAMKANMRMLALDDPAERYVPELKSLQYPTSDAPRITIRHLLSHSEGLPEDNPWGDRQLADTDDQMSAMMRAGIPFANAPGLAYEYSNYGF